MNLFERRPRVGPTFKTVPVFFGTLLLSALPLRSQNLTVSNSINSTSTTRLFDTIHRGDGAATTGTIFLSWAAFTTADGLLVPAGHSSVTISAEGHVSLSLVPNAGATPIGSYYSAMYHLDDGSARIEFWVVPVSQFDVPISSIASKDIPVMTPDSRDTSIYVMKAGDSMTGPLLLPADPVSASQAADKHYVDTSVAAVGGGSGGKVALAPSASQVIAQPTGTALSVNRLNGVEYASQYATGGQNNGISNATASTDCAAGCEVKADTSYATTEPLHPAQWNSQTHIEDTRKGGRWDSYLNPENVQTPGIESGQTIDVTSTRSGAALHQLTGTNDPTSIGLSLSHEAPVGGSNLFPQSVDGTPPYFKSAYSALGITGTYNTQGQHVLVPRTISCYGVGDCLSGSQFIYSSGGFRDEADEGAHPMDIQVSEDTHVFDGNCASGCSTGSTQLNIAATSGAGTQGDGRFLIDTNAAKVITTGSLIGGVSGTPHASATFSATSFPVSTFFATTQKIVSQSSDIAPDAVTIAIATSGQPTGYATSTSAAPATSGVACIADQTSGFLPSNYETANYTTVDATHFQMTLKKPHNTPATIAIGGLCGYGLEQTVDTTNGVRQVFPVVGSNSATSLYYAGTASAIVGHQGSTSAFVNVNLPIASLARTGNLVTVTTSSALPFDLNALPLTIAGVADSSYDGTFIVSTTGPSTITFTQSGANSTSTGGTASLLTGGFALYPMAEVLSVFDQAAKSVDGQMTLAPNTVSWATGDAVEEPHFFQQAIGSDITYVTQTTPRPTSYIRSGITYQGNNGPGLQGWSIANATPASNYVGNGGTHVAPDLAYQVSGIWNRSMVLQAGEQSAFTINCNSHGCGKWNSPFNLFELQSTAGTDTIQWQPGSSTLAFSLRGAPYSFSPSGFTAGTINATTIIAKTLIGNINAGSINNGTLPAGRLPTFGSSGSGHAPGAVPDPGPAAGASRFLREDGTWANQASLPQAGALLADYQLVDSGGTAPTDASGHGNTGSFPGGSSNPAWTQQGLSFNAITGTGQYFITAGTQNAKSVMIVYTLANPTSNNSPQPPYFDTLFGNPNIAGLAFFSANQAYGYQPGLYVNGAGYSNMDGSIVGTHVLVVVFGCSGCTSTTDQYFLDGISVGFGGGTGSFGKANAAFDVGGAPTGYETYMTGSIYRATFWSTQLSASDIAAASVLTKTLAQTRGVNFGFTYSPTITPQAVFTGDSLTNGEGVTPFENFLTTNTSYNVTNYGIGNITAGQNMSLLSYRERQVYAPNARSNVSFIWNGTNDMATHGETSQTAVSYVLSECNLMHSFGFKTIAATMISRTSNDPVKNTFNMLLRAQVLTACDALADFAAQPLVGADGANSGTIGIIENCPGGTTYFQADCIHLTQTGQQNMIAPIASHAIDQVSGSSIFNCDPNVVTAASYTSVAADGCKVFNTALNNITDTIPSAIGYTNRIIRRCNNSLSGSNTLTIAAPSDNPLNGIAGTTSVTVPNNACRDYKGTLVSASAGGAYWQQLN